MQAFLKTEKGRKNREQKIKTREIDLMFLINIKSSYTFNHKM